LISIKKPEVQRQYASIKTKLALEFAKKEPAKINMAEE
jgi:hypothetical protein